MLKTLITRIKAVVLGSKLYKEYRKNQKMEQHVSYGKEYPDQTFYVIGQDDQSGGMWWLINKVIMHIAYAIDKGYIPVVDLQHFKTQYTDKRTFGKVNIWEQFLKQPFGYSLDSNGTEPKNIAHAKNVILCKKEPAPFPEYLMGNTDYYENPERLQYFRNIFKQYIHFNSSTIQLFEKEKETLFKGRRMCGVLCRGTDYVAQRPKNHPIQPEPEDVIEDAKEVMNKYHCEGVFLATEDLDILNLFIDAFGENLSYVNQPRLSKKDIIPGELLAKSKKRLNITKSSYEDGVKYLVSTYLLSKCDCFIGGRTGGCKGVLLMSETYEHCKIYNLGFYS